MRLEPCGWVQPKAKRCGKVALLCKAVFFIGVHLPYTMAASRFYRYFLRNFPHLANVTDVCVHVRARARACVGLRARASCALQVWTNVDLSVVQKTVGRFLILKRRQ